MAQSKLLLLDGNSLAYRAFFALPPLTSASGIHTNAVYGFAMMLQKLLDEYEPTHMLVAFDAGKTTFRHAQYGDYKGGRQKTPPELSEQFPHLRRMLDAFGIAQYELAQYEADDIIGTLAREASARGIDTAVISGDKDLTQLASAHTTVHITRKGITDLESYTPAHIEEKYGISAACIVDMKGLMGDASDNIPGVPGIGEKTALKLLKAHGSIDGIYRSIEEIAGKMKDKLLEYEEQARLSKRLATIDTEAPLAIALGDLTYEGPDWEAVRAIWEELGFKTLLAKAPVAHALAPEQQGEGSHPALPVRDGAPDGFFERPLALHIERSGPNYHRADILGTALCDGETIAFFPGADALADEGFRSWLGDVHRPKYCSDAKAVQALAMRFDAKLSGAAFDLLLASYIANPAIPDEKIATIAFESGYDAVKDDDAVYGKGAKWTVPEPAALRSHIAAKAQAVFALKPILETRLADNGQLDLYRSLELPLASILGVMESTGIRVEREALDEMGVALKRRIAEIEGTVFEMAGGSFNINSPKQLGEVLFEKLGLPVLKKTKTGYSTAADVLEKLSARHPIVQEILLFRQLAKLQSTYIEGLTKEIGADGKIHTRYQQALTSTGRLSSTEPNLQNIPIRIEEGRQIRKAFVPSQPGWLLYAADYSQIELRVLAHFSRDENLMAAFQHGMDVHTKTASDVFHVEPESVTPLMRRHAKAVNFGIVYGISDYGLSESLGISRKEAAAFIERYLESFPGVQRYMRESVEEARRCGYASTLLNRRRYLPDIDSSNYNARGFAERTAMNTPIQGTAADILKQAMIEMDRRLAAEGLQARMLLQVHDELIFEGPASEGERLAEVIPDVMEHAVELAVPLKVDMASGATWYNAK